MDQLEVWELGTLFLTMVMEGQQLGVLDLLILRILVGQLGVQLQGLQGQQCGASMPFILMQDRYLQND